MSSNTCSICAGPLLPLPVPHESRAMLSDGRVVEVALEKASCLSCGLVSKIKTLSELQARMAYGDTYSLSSVSPLSDNARAQHYAAILAENFPPMNRVLEIGCGSGSLLLKMEQFWKETTYFLGIDPALPGGVISSGRRQYQRAFFDDSIKTLVHEKFDFIYSINVIEHVVAPKQFFQLAGDLLCSDGRLVIICPAASPPNLELVFHDHLHTFTPAALTKIAEKAGFSPVLSMDPLPRAGDFQLMAFRLESECGNARGAIPCQDAIALAASRKIYLEAWNRLEGELLSRTARFTHIALFGAGQMAALIRAYAPKVWDKVELLMMDSVDDAWKLDRPVTAYAEQIHELQDYAVIIASSPTSQGALARRLSNDGIVTIRFDDLILS